MGSERTACDQTEGLVSALSGERIVMALRLTPRIVSYRFGHDHAQL